MCRMDQPRRAPAGKMLTGDLDITYYTTECSRARDEIIIIIRKHVIRDTGDIIIIIIIL